MVEIRDEVQEGPIARPRAGRRDRHDGIGALAEIDEEAPRGAETGGATIRQNRGGDV